MRKLSSIRPVHFAGQNLAISDSFKNDKHEKYPGDTMIAPMKLQSNQNGRYSQLHFDDALMDFNGVFEAFTDHFEEKVVGLTDYDENEIDRKQESFMGSTQDKFINI